ncbi:MAG: Nicotinamide phosphoribosyltransferase [Candidatus Magasanikbacteria bacterium GW2011_GWC2_40_17]|nr:MAG: Nicotinamide phosphoribosyltransferase [Candidatus Magasanikbacteria bacterium GW2011_GWC2_40_17]
MNKESNILLLTDSYKVSHYKQYPTGTTRVFSFFESRGGRYPDTLFFGLQYIIKKHLLGQVVTGEKIREAKEIFQIHFGAEHFNEVGWRHILEVHGGRLPVRIKAVREGSRIPTSNALVTVVNTDPAVPWLTNYIETLLVQLWYPTTVATQSFYMKQTILRYLEETGTPELIHFKLHDFGFRGSTSVESAGIGGLAHLVNFKGTDTMEAIVAARKYYGEAMAGFSIPAAEHSTITSWGKKNEVLAFKNMLEQYPTGLVAVVSDSYDIFNACEELWGNILKTDVLKREGTVVIRPDSGNPVEILPRILEILGNRFGYEVNDKGYRVLNPKIRVIQGDGINHMTVGCILEAIKQTGWSADNIAFGSGGGLLQQVDRDTQKFAFKCCAVEIDGEWRDVMKDPVTDKGKRSKAGRLALIMQGERYKTIRLEDGQAENLLGTVFENGVLFADDKLSDIRKRAIVR